MKTKKRGAGFVLAAGLLAFLGFFPSAALTLKEGDLSLLRKLLEGGGFRSTGFFPASRELSAGQRLRGGHSDSGEGGRPAGPASGQRTAAAPSRLSYAKFGGGQGSNGSIIFVTGKGENHTKYIELFYDLSLQGWSPIYAYDHRGQGFSAGAPLPLKGESLYEAYRKDFEAFVRFVLDEGEADPDRLFLMAHSMGAAVVLDYLQTAEHEGGRQTAGGGGQPAGTPRPRPVFQAAALSAPMIKIQSAALSFFEGAIRGGCRLLPCGWSLPSLRGAATRRAFTGSPRRYDFSEYLEAERFPQAASRGASFRWVIESLDMASLILTPERIQRIAVPLLILQGEEDRFVSSKAHELFCAVIPHCCRIQKIKGSRHELFMETDGPRDQAVRETAGFFLNSQARQKKCRSIKLAEKLFAPLL